MGNSSIFQSVTTIGKNTKLTLNDVENVLYYQFSKIVQVAQVKQPEKRQLYVSVYELITQRLHVIKRYAILFKWRKYLDLH